MLPNKSVLILSSSLVLGILFVFFLETRISRSTIEEKQALYQSGLKEGKLAFSAKENMFPIDDNMVYTNCTTFLKSKEEVEGFIEGYTSFSKSN